ncbi:MAG: UDP-galactopyranose mutase [Butyrivibrio sp.]|nr:UDP-galactopyranose mutase [Butyrivibrio sp.]
MADSCDVIVVGCGLSGSVVARYLAQKGKKVVIYERRNHIGGNMYDYIDNAGLRVHKYGPHVFHTYNESLKDYMLQYGEWTEFKITSRVNMLGKFTPSPFNFQTIDDYYPVNNAENLKKRLLEYYSGRTEATIVELLESDDELIKEYADFLFQNDYSLYTAKQWGISPKDIDPSVLKRVPVYFSYKDGYFNDTYQMVPIDGYTNWFRELLGHENIKVKLDYDAFKHLQITENEVLIDGRKFDGLVVYTGAIDELFHGIYGSLPYRSLRFEWVSENKEKFQDAALVAYPAAKGFTRITEYSYFPQKSRAGKTSYAYEYPLIYGTSERIEPYYPVLTDDSKVQYTKYEDLAKTIPNLVCVGRLAKFKYYNMDQALDAALKECEEIKHHI